MKENWERSRPVQLLEMQELEWMLQSFMPGKKLEAFYLLGGGYSNTNYKLQVETLGDPLVLRVSSEKLCKFENSLHSRLQQNLPVPEIYFSESHGDRSFSFMEWRTGSQLKEVMYQGERNAVKQAAFSVGYWLSQIRKHTFTESGFLNENLDVCEPVKITPDTFLAFMEEFLIKGKTGLWIEKEMTAAVWDYARKNKHFLKDIDVEPALVHSDYNGLNILASKNNEPCEVTAIIDWEFAFAGPVYVDIGNMLRYENFRYYADFELAFIEGLEFGGIKLHKEWKRIAKLVDLIALCSLLNNQHGGENRIKDIKQLISQTLKYEK
ncbi:phosphotransferase family protein [Fictibacillus halophilus]|uniref:phosphotransferase family protein n=1 Tax=Fictibacillus halophilus TaxID=1610490 RepID=UPI0036256703